MLTGRRAAPQRTRLASRALEKIVSRCLEQDSARRWQSAADLDLALRRLTPRTYWREIRFSAAAVILLAAAILAWQYRTRAARLTDKDVVVLSDFTNTTGDPVFDGTLRQGLAIQLEQSP